MKRSLQEYVELVVFGLIALLVGTGLLWVVGWVLSLGGIVLKGLAGLLWMLLRFIVPVAIAGGLVYFLVKAAQGRSRADSSTAGGSTTSRTPADASYTPPAPTDVNAGTAVAGDAVVDVPTSTGGVTNGNVSLRDDAAAVARGAGPVDNDQVTTDATTTDPFDADQVTTDQVSADQGGPDPVGPRHVGTDPVGPGTVGPDPVASDMVADFDDEGTVDAELEDDERDEA